MSEEQLLELRELQQMAEDSWVLGSSGHRRETLKKISQRLTALITVVSGSHAKPIDCSGDPASCPDNEGFGCWCSDQLKKEPT